MFDKLFRGMPDVKSFLNKIKFPIDLIHSRNLLLYFWTRSRFFVPKITPAIFTFWQENSNIWFKLISLINFKKMRLDLFCFKHCVHYILRSYLKSIFSQVFESAKMRSLTFSVLLLTTLIILSPTESALIFYSRPRQVEPIVEKPKIKTRYALVPFLNAIKASGKVDWNVWKVLLHNQGILKALENSSLIRLW